MGEPETSHIMQTEVMEVSDVITPSRTPQPKQATKPGLSFLLEPNRLNVAISRAQCLSIVVGSPSLAGGIANTVAEAEQINRLCEVMRRNEVDHRS